VYLSEKNKRKCKDERSSRRRRKNKKNRGLKDQHEKIAFARVAFIKREWHLTLEIIRGVISTYLVWGRYLQMPNSFHAGS
jgi:hypothetical protein